MEVSSGLKFSGGSQPASIEVDQDGKLVYSSQVVLEEGAPVLEGKGITFGSDPQTSLNESKAAYLGTVLENLGYRDDPVEATLVKSIHYAGELEFTAIAQDASNVYVAGRAASATSGGIGGEDYYLPSSSGAVIAKINQEGLAEWGKPIGNARISDIAVDSNGNVYVAGYFSGPTIGLSSPASNVTTAGREDAFVVKYNSSGSSQWARRVGATVGDKFTAVAVGGSGNVYAAGYFSRS